MKKKSLLTSYSLLFIIFCSCVFVTVLSIHSDLQAAFNRSETYQNTSNAVTDNEEEPNDFISWKSVSHHLFTFNR